MANAKKFDINSNAGMLKIESERNFRNFALICNLPSLQLLIVEIIKNV